MRIALISTSDEVPWQSCQSITKGLKEAYGAIKPKVKVSEYLFSNTSPNYLIIENLAKLIRSKPDMIVFLDTWPFFGKILSVLAKEYQDQAKKPRLRFHSYGDFTLRAYQWLKWAKDLECFQVEWACASEQQRKLVQSLLMTPEPATWVCPFPVHVKDFEFSAKSRDACRKKMNIEKNQFVVFYAGRLSLQKNVVESLRAFSMLPNKILSRSKLVLVGNFDNLGAPFSNTELPPGAYYRLWQQELDRLGAAVSKKVSVLPGVSREHLHELYCAADVFLSLSLVHDEDFGMGPAEAAVAGLPLVLTGWGGYAGFRNLKFEGEWVPVSLNSGGPSFQLQAVAQALEHFAVSKDSIQKRKLRGQQAAKKLSVLSVSKLIQSKTLNSSQDVPKFCGFQDEMRTLSDYFNSKRSCVIYPNVEKGSTYEKIYSNYI